jgi:hypothetical protein
MNKSTIRIYALHRQVERLERHIAVLSNQSRRLSWLRISIFLIGASVTIAAFQYFAPAFGLSSLVISLAIFAIAVYVHRRVNASITRFKLWKTIKRAHIARLGLDWNHIPLSRSSPPDPSHPFESDLDLVGERSIMHLIDITTSRESSSLLRSWLTAANPDLNIIHQRQAIVRELADMPYFRDRLTLNSYLTTRQFGEQVDFAKLMYWLEAQSSLPSLRRALYAAVVLAFINIILFFLYQQAIIPPLWLLSFVPYFIISALQFRQISNLFENTLVIGDFMKNLQAVFGFLETYRFKPGSPVEPVCSPFQNPADRPSRHLHRISRTISAASLQRTQLLWLFINVIVPWDLFFVYRLEILKADLKHKLPDWLHAWFELESLNSLANLAYLNPEYTFPILTHSEGFTPVFRALELGHPLLPSATRVTNDFSIPSLGRVAIVTGSNMSGKSSFLRTLGVNLSLANAGGPVCAREFESRFFRIYTCIKVSDSVTDGISYFYAEVKRLKALLNALEANGQPPLFFLIDEIFRGTNNRERLIGSQSYVRALTDRSGVGIVSTHDLELVHLEESNAHITNYHFEELIQDGKMIFDYRLRPGPSRTTNALRIMEIEGLPVDMD